MSTIGHNGDPTPDPLTAHEASIRDLAELVSGLTAITTQDQADQVDAILGQCRDAFKAADEARKAEKKPHDDAAAAVQVKWKPVLAIADKTKAETQALLTPWKLEQDRIRQERTDAARKAAEALQAAAQAKLHSDDIAERVEAEIDLQAAGKATAKANAIGREASGLRGYPYAVITDRRAALNHYIKTQPEAFEALIQTLADKDARGLRPDIPGVAYHKRKVAA